MVYFPTSRGDLSLSIFIGPVQQVQRVRYICYSKTRKQTDCDGQTGNTAHILDGIIDKLVRQIFEYMKAILKSEIVNCLIRWVEVYRDYKLHIDFNIDFTQFSLGLDIVEIAA